MIFRPLVLVLMCIGLFIIFELLIMPKVLAFKTNGLRIDDQRLQTKRNYMIMNYVIRARYADFLKGRVNYDAEIITLNPICRVPKELANTVDNPNTSADQYFLDKPVETRTKKRGNIQLEKIYPDQSLPVLPCACKYSEDVQVLGDSTFPTSVLTRSCSNSAKLKSCPFPYKCKEIMYPVPILKKKSKQETFTLSEDIDLLPRMLKNLSISWDTEYKNIGIGCQCINKYTGTINN